MIAVALRAPVGRWRSLSHGVLVGAATLLLVAMLGMPASYQPAFDFRYQYYGGAQAVADGRPLYVEPDDPALEAIEAYVYPPQLAVALTPITALSVDVAVVIALLWSVAALMGALATVGVRDIRCYAAVVLWWPTWTALSNVNLTATLALGVALAWRFRAALGPHAAVLGLVVSAKLFLWPLLVWTAAIRSLGVAVAAAAVGAAVALAAWAVIGFQGLAEYPALLQRLAEIHAHESYSFVGMADVLGADAVFGHVAMVLVGGALLLACILFGQRGDDLRSFTCAIAAALALTPIVWQHYLLLFLAPLGVARPRLSSVWLLPVLLWLSPHPGDPGTAQAFLLAAVLAVVLRHLLARPRPRGVTAETE